MEMFNKPKNLNGNQLRDELRNAGISISDDISAVSIDENGFLVLNISENDFELASDVVAKHEGNIVIPELTPLQKLSNAGLTPEDLKTILGL